MTKLSKNELLDALAQYGYELNKPLHTYKGEEVLLSLAKENDARLLEGFPVVYKNMLENQKRFNWDDPNWDFRKVLSEKDRGRFLNLLLVTYVLFKLYGEDKYKLSETENALFKLSTKWRDQLKTVESNFSNSNQVRVDDKLALSTDRLKQQFRNYVVNFKSKEEPKLDMQLELALSEFFTAKQKDLLKKRLKGDALTKTENEYFSRVVNKRLKALSNNKLHNFVISVADYNYRTTSAAPG